jgi:rhamnosyltransferase
MIVSKADKYPIAATVILYNPQASVVVNLETFRKFVDLIVIVDNSDNICLDISSALKKHDNILYVNNNQNLGIASALNTAAKIAYQRGYHWLLTMDQDSAFNEHQVEKFLQLPYTHFQDRNTAGIFTPYHATQTAEHVSGNQNKLAVVKTCMTSGNLINLAVWQKVKGFDEKLFIDYVDHEYCLKIRKQGYMVMQDNTTVLKHQLGEAERIQLASVSYTTSHHNYIRRYYITRNRLYFIAKYFWFDPRLCLSEIYSLFAESVKILLQEQQKFKKFKSIIRGVRDFFIGNYGRYRYL